MKARVHQENKNKFTVKYGAADPSSPNETEKNNLHSELCYAIWSVVNPLNKRSNKIFSKFLSTYTGRSLSDQITVRKQ